MIRDDALVIVGALALRDSIERALGRQATASTQLTQVDDAYLLALAGLRCVLDRVADAVEELGAGDQEHEKTAPLAGRLSR